MWYRRLSTIIIVFLMVFLTTGSQVASGEEKVTGKVTIWFDSGAAWNPFIEAFNADMKAKYLGIEVEWVTQDPARISTKLVTAFAAKEGPDIALAAVSRLTAAEIQFGVWEDLNPYVKTDPEFKDIIDHLLPESLNDYQRDGKLWGLPQVVQTVGIFIRKGWFDKVGGRIPEDWNELTQLAVKFKEQDPGGIGKDKVVGYGIFGAPGATNGAAQQFIYSGAAAGMKYPMIEPKEGKPSFNTPTGVKVARWLHDWMLKYKVASPATPTWTHKEFYMAVQGGYVGIGRVGAWNVGPWSKTAIGLDYFIIPYPPMEKGGENYQVAWSNGIVMSASAKNKKATYVIFKELMSKKHQTSFYEKLTSSARTDLDWGRLAANEQLRYFTKPQRYSWELAYFDTWKPTEDILSKHLNAMLVNPKADPAKVLAEAEKEALAKWKEITKK